MNTRRLTLALSALALATGSFTAYAGNYTFSNNSPITISDNAPASTYPSTINVSGTTGTVTKVSVTLTGLTHTFPADLDIMLVSPTGQHAMLMSDAGAGNDIVNGTLTFSMAALNTLPATIVSGTYVPNQLAFGDAMPAPAPADDGVSGLATFNGNTANGNWQLYIVDDLAGDTGSLQGWSLSISTDPLPTASMTVANTAAIGIPDSGAATPYPSTIAVSGAQGTIQGMSVKLKGLSHTFPGDLDIMLVAPNGAHAMLMSDVGATNDLSNADLTFSMDALASMVAGGPNGSGTYLPTHPNIGDPMPSPAPADDGVIGLAAFNGQSPNGTWSLYVVDDTIGDSGSVAGGWELTFRGVDNQSCASSGYTGTKLTWCKNVCEKGYTGATLDMWIHRWIEKYRDLPYCMQEETPPPPPVQQPT